MEKLCEARRTRISQIQKYLFPIQVNPVFQVLGTPPLKDVNTDISKGVCLQHWHLAVVNPWKDHKDNIEVCVRPNTPYNQSLSQFLRH